MRQHRQKHAPGRRSQIGAVALAALMLSGCSSTPDWANPVEWYRGTRDWVVGEDAPSQDARARANAKQQQQGSAGQFPNLASVPDRPKDIADTDRAERVQSGLVADRAQARHAALEPGSSRPGAPPPPVIAAPPQPPGVASAAPPPAAPPAPPEVMARQGSPTAPPPPSPGTLGTLRSSELAPPVMAPEPPPPALGPATGAPDGGALAAADRGTDTTRTAFEEALTQSGGVVAQGRAQAATGIRDVNRSSVVANAGGRGAALADGRGAAMLAPPPRGSVALRAPGAQPASFGTSPGAPAATILFGNSSSKLSGSDRQAIENIAKQVAGRGGTVRVVGHASSRTLNLDPVRHRLVNFRVSLARAQAVADALVSLGVPAQNVVVEARADNEPLYHEFMPSGEASNRRAEIYLDY